MRDRVTIVVPCFNEASRLDTHAFRAALEAWPWIEFIFVDDGSTDRTLDKVRELTDPRVRVVALPRNVGKAEAIRAGLRAAFEPSPGFVGYWDADLSTSLGEIPKMLEIFSENAKIQLVMGSRVHLLGRHIDRKPSRHYLGRVFATFVSMALEEPVYDTQCGAKLFRNSKSLSRVFEEPFETRWLVDVEILFRLRRIHREGALDGLVVEHPLAAWTHKPGSKVRPSDFFRASLELVKLRREFRR